jgi:hypothetical protein
MEYDAQLRHALQTVSQGASAMRYAARAQRSSSGLGLSPDFMRRALTAPLSLLAGFVWDEPLPQVRVQRNPVRRARMRRATPQQAKGKGLPKPIDLGGLDTRLRRGLVDNRLDKPDPELEASNCRALFLEIIRRAAFDWVLYRTSSKLLNRQLAESAYVWLFSETQNSHSWSLRRRHGKEITAFLTVCAMLDLDPEHVRNKIRGMTERDIMGAGRPAERRKYKNGEEAVHGEDLPVFDVDVDALPLHDCMFAPEPPTWG